MNWVFILRRFCRLRSFRRTVIFLVVILVQIWLAVPVIFQHIKDNWPETFDVSVPDNFQPPFLPIVIFSSYRPKYLEKTLRSIASSGNVQPTTPCLFILHHTKHSTMDDINETYKVLGKITFCRKLVSTYGNDKEERTPAVLKSHWWLVMKKIFEEKDPFQLKSNSTYTGDVFFIEDDAILSPDFMEVMWFSLYVKNTFPETLFSTLQGMGSENLVEHQPDTFVISQVPVVESVCYSFNVTAWNYIKKVEKESVAYTEKDWPLALGLLLFYDRNETVQIVAPTISRIWHVGGKDLSSTDQSDIQFGSDNLPPWKKAKEQRYLNMHKARILPGIRDMYGRLCHPCELESRVTKFPSSNFPCRCFCPVSNFKKYWNWQIAAFVPATKRMVHCQLVSHLMIMVVFIITGVVMFGYLMVSK
ncbi:predicted protein [Nematostella vectensis]|uniref:Uncharacterized protein n=1 Tax=Nematostella vectensis TaxID=45351 RepID=A7RNZ8_NEMVE|nr:uncharacterized protein LOC5518907 [Nematostella vectensis]EDO46826.1 predicted protein [Nematostella vectensis]|eukprot:XP_001638889.1 predicted protein [Nematostella vectensis]